MRARLALAQALLPEPELLILDEPGDGLDPEGIHEMRQTILRLRRELGLTILLSSHLLNEVEQMCTRIAVLKEGRKVFDGPMDEVRRSGGWRRLRVSDFAAAAGALQQAGLIRDAQPPDRILLAEGVGSDKAVRQLVLAGLAVYEITHEEQTLENFYLSLVKQQNAI
jgi:ABC-2 type transport system ATP-binding protein